MVGGPRSGCAGGECNSVPFDLSSTDRRCGYWAPIVACSFNQVTRIAKILDARLRSKPPRGRKLFTYGIRIFLTSQSSSSPIAGDQALFEHGGAMNWPRQPTDDRLNILRVHDHFREWRSLDDQRVCAVCGGTFSGHEVEISQSGEEFKLNCPTKNCPSRVHQWAYPEKHHLSCTNSENWWRALSSNDGSESTPSSPQCQQI